MSVLVNNTIFMKTGKLFFGTSLDEKVKVLNRINNLDLYSNYMGKL